MNELISSYRFSNKDVTRSILNAMIAHHQLGSPVLVLEFGFILTTLFISQKSASQKNENETRTLV